MTHRHEMVVEEYLINGNIMTDAWKKYYPKCTDRSASRTSSNFFKRVDVIQMIDERQTELKDMAIITKEEIIKTLVDIMLSSTSDSKAIAIKAAVELNKMMGYNAADKKEITHHGEIIWQEEKTYKDKE